jgi:putative ABC transport system substrate-binding protein
MRRREVVSLLIGAAAAWPLAARAQSNGRIPVIGFLGPAALKTRFAAFRAGLSDLGYVEGKNVKIESRFWVGDGHEHEMEELARELVALKVDVIVTSGDEVYGAHRVTKTVPIVAAVTGDIVADGLADSPGHPGGNVTGETFFVNELFVKRIALLKEIKPAMTSVGMLVIRGLSEIPSHVRALNAPVKALGVELQLIEVADPSECDRALDDGPGASIGGLLVIDTPSFLAPAGAAAVAAAAAHHALPSAGSLSFARKGGLIGYAVEVDPMYRRAATFVDKILKGAKPGDIPIEQATRFRTIINLKTAKALGLVIPPTLLAGADEVIE